MLNILLNLLMVQIICGKLGVSDIKIIQETPIISNTKYLINGSGSLSPLRGYIYHTDGYTHNKRLFSPEIKVKYSLKKEAKSNNFMHFYKYERFPGSDKFRIPLKFKPTENQKYTQEYHSRIIKMFPSAVGDLSIEAGRDNAFTLFLKSDTTKPYTKYILASLLLLSEGVDMRISVDYSNNKKRLILKNKKETKEYINADMCIDVIDSNQEIVKIGVYQSEVTEIINFFRRYRVCPSEGSNSTPSEPRSKEEFKTGIFMSSIGFLIESYIFEYIDNVQEYIEFIDAVYELLCDQMERDPEQLSDKRRKIDKVFDRLFVPIESLDNELKYIMPLYSIKQTMDKYMVFPFCESSQLPIYTRIEAYTLSNGVFKVNKNVYYSDCVESALLGLFCCLAYDPETHEYTTKHMGNTLSAHIKKFFEKYPRPTNTTTYEMHLDWSKVVCYLNNERISYVGNKVELRSGVLNILQVIKEITGINTSAWNVTNTAGSNPLNIIQKLDKNNLYSIEESVRHAFMSLTKNSSLKVQCKEFDFKKRSDDVTDAFGKIELIYTYDNIVHGICLNVQPRHTHISLLYPSSSFLEKLSEQINQIKTDHNEINNYTGYLINQHITSKIRQISLRSVNSEYIPKNEIYTFLQNYSGSVCELFILRKIDSVEYKSFIFRCILLYSQKNQLSENNPLVQLSSNILGSVPLDDLNTRLSMLNSCICNLNYSKYYPDIEYTLTNIPNSEFSLLQVCGVFDCIIESGELDQLLTCLDISLKLSRRRVSLDILLRRKLSSAEVLEFIFRSGGIRAVNNIQNILESYVSRDDKELNTLYIMWFITACKRSNYSSELVRYTYNLINYEFIPDVCTYAKENKCNFDLIISALLKEKDKLRIKKDRKSMKKYKKIVKQFNESTGIFSKYYIKTIAYITPFLI
ncbi:hypothetical protein NEPAR07_1524 [Nematocida parisii]|uniref:Vitellogenin domain-containing protein n=1 Tax=Nematocida parisii (strain ERTm3) TaxID=935791 RepID=I3EJM2_NEMP3|nr:hypothetical protein NEQG_00189 [Nematocida parisii ERTm3]KAI5145198.1 hypothetical protein NEPAR07_1524 [Nematocida parisii]